MNKGLPLEIVYGTGNPGKAKQMQSVLTASGLAVTVRSSGEFGIELDVEEDGRTAEENARKKALAYSVALRRPVISMDSALYFDDLPDELQPGLYVRRPGGTKRMDDDEMLAYYMQLIDRFGGRLNGHWKTAFALALPDGTCEVHAVVSPRIFVSVPHQEVPEGNPMTALQIDPATGKRVLDLTPEERARTVYSWGTSLAEFLAKKHPKA
jgi:inosine/xanthosine triphosphate pyrophosphatase family protein